VGEGSTGEGANGEANRDIDMCKESGRGENDIMDVDQEPGSGQSNASNKSASTPLNPTLSVGATTVPPLSGVSNLLTGSGDKSREADDRGTDKGTGVKIN
jgi:hypothetical protein